jgi:hypothetical protein
MRVLGNVPVGAGRGAAGGGGVCRRAVGGRRFRRVCRTGEQALICSHRLAHDADRIAVMEDVRIGELGTRHERLERGGAYAALWNSRQGHLCRHPLPMPACVSAGSVRCGCGGVYVRDLVDGVGRGLGRRDSAP